MLRPPREPLKTCTRRWWAKTGNFWWGNVKPLDDTSPFPQRSHAVTGGHSLRLCKGKSAWPADSLRARSEHSDHRTATRETRWSNRVRSTHWRKPQPLRKAIKNAAGSCWVKVAWDTRESPPLLFADLQRGGLISLSRSESLSFLIICFPWGPQVMGRGWQHPCGLGDAWWGVGMSHSQHRTAWLFRRWLCSSPCTGEPRCRFICHKCLEKSSPFCREQRWAWQALCPHHGSQMGSVSLPRP